MKWETMGYLILIVSCGLWTIVYSMPRDLKCLFGLHRWRKVAKRNRRYEIGYCMMTYSSALYGEFTFYKKRCKWCGKEKCL